MYKNAISIYSDTTETLGLTPLTNYLSWFGGWPMTLDHWEDSSFNWTNTTASSLTTFNLPILISIFNDLDSDNTENSLIYIDQDSLYLPRSVLANLTSNPTITTAYQKIITESAKAIRDWLQTNVSDVQIDGQVEAVLKFESQLAMVLFKTLVLVIQRPYDSLSIQITVSDEDRRNSTRMYNPMTLVELQNWTDEMSITNSPDKVMYCQLKYKNFKDFFTYSCFV